MLLPFLFAMKLIFIERGREELAEIGKEQGQPAKDGKKQGQPAKDGKEQG